VKIVPESLDDIKHIKCSAIQIRLFCCFYLKLKFLLSGPRWILLCRSWRAYTVEEKGQWQNRHNLLDCDCQRKNRKKFIGTFITATLFICCFLRLHLASALGYVAARKV